MTRPGQTEFDLLAAAKRGQVADLARHLVAGTLLPADWSREMSQVLLEGHARAGYLGRQRAGDLAPYDGDDTEFGRMIMADEQPFLDRFRADLLAGRYDDDEGRTLLLPVLSRAELYVRAMLGTANEAFAGVSGAQLVYWRLGQPEMGHCPECPQMAAGSPYRAVELTRTPGDGSTTCMSACHCWLERADGVTGFRAPRLK